MKPLEACVLALCAGVAAVGYGSGLARILRIRPNLGDRGILGLLTLGFLGCVLHFMVALSTPLQAVVLAAGAIMAALLWRDLRSDASLSLAAAAGVCIFVLLNVKAHDSYDIGLYFLQTFKWNHEFPLTAGLGNLHGRLAFNSILFLIAPLTDQLQIGWIPNFLAVTFLMLSLCGRLRHKDLSSPAGCVQYWFIVLAVSSFVLVPQYLKWLDVLRSDSMAAVLIVYWVALALGFSRSGDRRTTFALLVATATLAATVKISASPLLALTMALGWFQRKKDVPGATRAWTVSAIVLAAWMLRGVMLSGCAVYPVRQTCLSGLPWAELPAQVDDEQMSIRSWARRPMEFNYASVLRDWSWFPQWLRTARHDGWMQLLLIGAIFGALGAASAGAEIRRQFVNEPLEYDPPFVAAGLAASLAFWFFSAPDPRFAAGFIFSAALLGLSLAVTAWLRRPFFSSLAPHALVALMVLLGVHRLTLLRTRDFLYTIPETPTYQIPIARGAGIWVPRATDQCWAHELPCAPPYIDFAGLSRVRWPVVWPYLNDPSMETPPGWTPLSGILRPKPKP